MNESRSNVFNLLFAKQRLLGRLEAENTRLRGTVVELMFEIQTLREAHGHPQSEVQPKIPTPDAVSIVHMPEQKQASQPVARVAPVASFAIMMRYKGEERASDIPLSSDATEELAREAALRDLDIAGLVGQVLVATINKDMMDKILH